MKDFFDFFFINKNIKSDENKKKAKIRKKKKLKTDKKLIKDVNSFTEQEYILKKAVSSSSDHLDDSRLRNQILKK